MNTEAQRARNKRKRDKLREKRRMLRGDAILRFRIDGEATKWCHPCGLIHPTQLPGCWVRGNFPHCCSNFTEKPGHESEDYTEFHECSWSTEWVYMTTHDLSSSAHDAICAYVNTMRSEFHFTELDSHTLIIQLGGVTRRKVWRGCTVGVKQLERAVCLYAKTLLHE